MGNGQGPFRQGKASPKPREQFWREGWGEWKLQAREVCSCLGFSIGCDKYTHMMSALWRRQVEGWAEQ